MGNRREWTEGNGELSELREGYWSRIKRIKRRLLSQKLSKIKQNIFKEVNN